ncbi:MAG: response regulator transcription factor [bacterium]
MKVLVVDDDTALTEILSEYFLRNQIQLDIAHDGESALAHYNPDDYDVILLDIMLPGVNGLEVLQTLRRRSSVPILMLTAKGEEDDRVTGLNLGADDYVAKPFSSRELLARLHALNRRRLTASEPALAHQDIELLHNQLAANVGGKRIELTGAECSLLTQLLRSPNQPIAREVLYRRVLGREVTPFDRSLDTHISNLRRKLGDTPDKRSRIRSIRGVGYILTC